MLKRMIYVCALLIDVLYVADHTSNGHHISPLMSWVVVISALSAVILLLLPPYESK